MPDMLHDPIAVGVGSAVSTSLLAWLGQRLVGKAAIQEAVNESFREIMDQLRKELRAAIHERDKARDERDAANLRIEELERMIDAFELRIAGTTLPRTKR